MSKQKGDGSLAHEWSHFLDFQLAKYGDGKATFLSERIEKQAKSVHPIGKAMAELMTVMKTEEAAENVTGNMAPQRWYLKRWIERWAGGNVTDAQLAYDRISEQYTRSFLSGRNARANSINLVDSIARMTKSPMKVRIRYLKDRAYFAEAKGMGKYWSSSVELFARAFESFIEDQLHRRTCLSEFLVYGTRRDFSNFSGSPYPKALQRKQINHAIANLINVIADNG